MRSEQKIHDGISKPSKPLSHAWKIQDLTRKINLHKARRRKHLKALTKLGLSLEEKRKREEGIAIQSAIIEKLKKLKEEAAAK